MKVDNVQQRQRHHHHWQHSQNENKNWIKCLRSMVWNFSFIFFHFVCSFIVRRTRFPHSSPSFSPAVRCGIAAVHIQHFAKWHFMFHSNRSLSNNDYEVVNLVGDNFRNAKQCDHQPSGWHVSFNRNMRDHLSRSNGLIKSYWANVTRIDSVKSEQNTGEILWIFGFFPDDIVYYGIYVD